MIRRYRIFMTACLITSVFYVLVLNGFFSNGEPLFPEHKKVCHISYDRTSSYNSYQNEDLTLVRTIYVITPTYLRPEMFPELMRVGQTLLLVPKVHWIVAEESNKCSHALTDFLLNMGLPFTHIAVQMPVDFRDMKGIEKPRGVANRRSGLDWIRTHGEEDAVLYFLDDDNTIDVKLFEQMRSTKKVSMWPVGLVGEYAVSSPVVDENGKVVAFWDNWAGGRKFQVDMAGFAVSVDFFKKHKRAAMPYIAGLEEDMFLKSLKIELDDIEPMANGCSEILVWHTQAKKNPARVVDLKDHTTDNISALGNFMKKWGLLM